MCSRGPCSGRPAVPRAACARSGTPPKSSGLDVVCPGTTVPAHSVTHPEGLVVRPAQLCRGGGLATILPRAGDQYRARNRNGAVMTRGAPHSTRRERVSSKRMPYRAHANRRGCHTARSPSSHTTTEAYSRVVMGVDPPSAHSISWHGREEEDGHRKKGRPGSHGQRNPAAPRTEPRCPRAREAAEAVQATDRPADRTRTGI